MNIVKTCNNQQEQSPKESTVLKYYHRYEYLAKIYAHKIFDTYKISYEIEDLEQEFRMKIYTSIIAYGARWKRYKESGTKRPIPIEFYIKSALSNRSKDFIHQIQNQQVVSYSIEEHEVDYGELNTIESDFHISNDSCKYEINGINLLEGLSNLESRCFVLFLQGFTVGKLNKMFKKAFEANRIELNPNQMINKQVNFLRTKKLELMENVHYQFSRVNQSVSVL